MTGARYFAEMMSAYEVSHLFFVPTIIIPAMAAMEGKGITRVVTHGEKAAAYMADGYARASGKPGLALAQTVGAANLAAGLRDAYMAGSPVIAITGGRQPESKYRRPYQEIEDFPMFAPVTKWNAEVDDVNRIPDMLRQAFRVATTGAPGPVHLEFRGNHGHVAEEEGDLDLIFEKDYSRYPAFRPEPDLDRVRQALKILAEAKRPIIVAGGGVTASQAGPELVELAEKLNIPVVTALNAKGQIPENHPLALGVVGTYSRTCANKSVAEADVVFFIGSHTGGQVTHFWRLPRTGTTVIQLDIAPEELGRNYPNAASILGDARVSLRRMIEMADRGPERTEWLERTQAFLAEWKAMIGKYAESEAVPMRPERVCRELSAWLPSDAVLVSDTGHSGMWTGAQVDLNYASQRFIRCAGSLGWGFPGAMGVKCALPDKPVLCFTGDGGLYYHLAELETAARYGINLVVLVNDNRSLNQEIKIMDQAYGGKQGQDGREMWVFDEVDLAKVAESMGCHGIRVEKPGQLASALDQAFAAKRPVVVDVVTDIEALAPLAWS
jgi:acetolactate synthase-1/2/3 large subunit